jgi:hypothetical protein
MRKGSFLSSSATFASFAPFNDRSRNWALFVANLLLLLMLYSLSWPWARWSTDFVPFWRWVLWIAAAVVSLVILALVDLRRRGARVEAATFLVCAPVAGLVSWYLAYRKPGDPVLNFMMYRYVHVTSGVSPAVPWLLLCGAGLWWVWYTLSGLALLDIRLPCLPSRQQLKLTRDPGIASSRGLESLDHLSSEDTEKLRNVLKPVYWDWRVYGPTILIATLPLVEIELRHPFQSFEGWFYDTAYGFVLGFIVFLLVSGLLRLWVVWFEFQNLLMYLDRFPLRRSFERLKGFSWKPIWRGGGVALQDSFRVIWRQFESLDHLWNMQPQDRELSQAIEAARELRKTVGNSLRAQLIPPQRTNSAFIRFLQSAWATQPAWVDDWIKKFCELQKQLALTCAVCLRYLSREWDSEITVDMFEVSRRVDTNRREGRPEPLVTQLAEQFVCLFYLNFILSVLLRMRTLVMSAAGMFVFVLLSFSSYPFEPASSFHTIMILLFLFIALVVAVVLAQMHRDATLSRITDTIPGELGTDFWFRLTSFVAVPLLSLLAAQFPEIGRWLFSWLEPALQAIK